MYDQTAYAQTRGVVDAFLRAEQASFRLVVELTGIERTGRAMSRDERDQLAGACDRVAHVHDQVAAAWESYRPKFGLAKAHRRDAVEYRRIAELNRAVAPIAKAYESRFRCAAGHRSSHYVDPETRLCGQHRDAIEEVAA